MEKYKTRLGPFLSRLLSLLVREDNDLTEVIRREYNKWKKSDTKFPDLSMRKDTIFHETMQVLSITADERDAFFAERIQNRECGLCLSCIGCENQYWKDLQGMLGQENVRMQHGLPKRIKDLLTQKEKPEEIYVKNYRLTRQIHECHNRLIMLKGFSSSMPFLLNYSLNTNHYSGGGFYLNWNGIGIAVDPGYHFVQNLHQNGLNVLDIDVVIITHEHIDHNSDMRLLDDLHYNASKVFRDERWDLDTDGDILRGKTPQHIIKWYMDEVTYTMAELLQEKGSGFAKGFNEINLVKPEQGSVKSIELSEWVDFQVFRTQHEQQPGQKDSFLEHTFGCAFTCRRKDGRCRKIGYTSDTSYHPEVVPDMCEALEACDVLVENISGIYENDILLKKPKERHLGYYGCYKLIEELHAKSGHCIKYVLLSEFSNLINDIRFDVAGFMQEDISRHICDDIWIYPAEVGMTVDLDNLLIQCSECREFTGRPAVVRQEDENMQIRYCCDKCMY